MALRLVDTAPGVSTAPVAPGAPIQFALKTTTSGHNVELGTLQENLGYSRVMNSGLLPDQDPNLSELGAVVQFQTTEMRNPVTGTVAVTDVAPGILFTKSDNSDNDKCVYAVQFPIQDGASCLAYFKFKVRPSWTLFSPDWLHLSNMTGMYFGLEHGTYNSACYFFLRNAVAGGSGVIGGPLQAFNTTRPGQTELAGFQWSTLPTNTEVEVWIFFNTLGYGSPFSPVYVPVVEVWTRRAGVDTEPVVQLITPVGTLGSFQSLSDTSFPNVRAGSTNLATMYFGNAGRTGDLLQLDDWAFFPDFRACVNTGQAMPNSEMTAWPDCLVSFHASDNLLPTQEVPYRWFPLADTGFLLPATSFVYQPNDNITPYALSLSKTNTAGTGFYKEEPRLENGVEGAMIEGFLYANQTERIVDSFGAGLTIEDGTHLFGAYLIQTSEMTTIGILETFLDQSINGYYYPPSSGGFAFVPMASPLVIDWTTPHLVRLTLDKLRQKVSLYVDEELVLEISSTGTFPNSVVNYGRMGFGFPYPGVEAKGTLNVAEVNYSPRYKAYEVRDLLPPQNVSWMPWTLNVFDMNGSGAFDATLLTGTVTVNNGSPNVVGVGTSFTKQVTVGQYLKRQSDLDVKYDKVQTIISDTQITLASNYLGTSGVGVSAVVTNPDSVVVTKTQFNTAGTYTYYSRNDDFGEDKGCYVDFEAQVQYYTDSTGRGFAPLCWTGAGLTLLLGNKSLQVVFVDGGSSGRFVGVIPGSGSVSDLINQTALGKNFSSQVNWSQPTRYRLVVRAYDAIEIWDTTIIQAPLIRIPWSHGLNGFDLPLLSATPSIQFGHFDFASSSTSAWTYVRYGIGDGFAVSVEEQFPSGMQPYLFGGKVFSRPTFDQS